MSSARRATELALTLIKAAPLRSAAARSGLRPRSRGRANSMHQAD